ncbi:MAG: class I SAM-dependent methyltransferase [Sporomusaceae bacterium]|nr:class I SAM-dependent methyltransferase [Sporomusaceae bacterium]
MSENVLSAANAMAKIYNENDRQPIKVIARMIKNIKNLISVSDKHNFIDVGCGIGNITSLIAKQFQASDVVGIDISREMINRARKNNFASNLQYLEADAINMPFAGRSISCITFFNSWHLLPHRAQVISELKRIVIPGGLIMIVGIDRNNLLSQVIHQKLPLFHKKDYNRHESLELLETRFQNSGFHKKMHKEYAYNNNMGTPEETIQFLKNRPYFGLKLLSDDEFNSDLAIFNDWINKKNIKKIINYSISSMAIFSKSKDEKVYING